MTAIAAHDRTARAGRVAAALIPLLCFALLAPLLVGCNVAGVLAYKLGGGPTVEPKYEPAKVPLLVLVEDYRSPESRRLDAERVARRVTDLLKEHDVAPVIEQDELRRLRETFGDTYRNMTIPTVGRSAGAKQVLYVDLTSFAIEPALGSNMIAGRAEARVHVVDVDTGLTRWPVDSGGYPVSVQIPYQRSENGSEELILQDKLDATLAEQVGQLFYASKAEHSDGE